MKIPRFTAESALATTGHARYRASGSGVADARVVTPQITQCHFDRYPLIECCELGTGRCYSYDPTNPKR